MQIGMIGLGYVGLVTAVGFAELGHNVYCHDIDESKLEMLSWRETPIYEEGLQEKLNDDSIFGNIHIERKIEPLLERSDMIFVAVGTPSSDDGSANTCYVEAVVRAIALGLCKVRKACEKIVVIKSTVPVGFTNKMNCLLQNIIKDVPEIHVKFAFCPEFLREGTALNDFLNPERIVIGAEDEKTSAVVGEIYDRFRCKGVPFVYTNCASAEIVKYASNIMLAVRVAVINEVADYAEIAGGRIEDISKAVGLDSRIGNRYLKASLGFGGSCLPKDVKAFSYFTNESGLNLPVIQSIFRSNEAHITRQKERICKVAQDYNLKNILVLGTAFKADTDDIRESSSIKLVNQLVKYGLNVTVADPEALNNTKRILADSVSYTTDFYSVLGDTDMLVICTDWEQFAKIDIVRAKQLMKGNIIFDLRNILSRSSAESYGFKYFGIAR